MDKPFLGQKIQPLTSQQAGALISSFIGQVSLLCGGDADYIREMLRHLAGQDEFWQQIDIQLKASREAFSRSMGAPKQ